MIAAAKAIGCGQANFDRRYHLRVQHRNLVAAVHPNRQGD
jgi:hypothetical protein